VVCNHLGYSFRISLQNYEYPESGRFHMIETLSALQSEFKGHRQGKSIPADLHGIYQKWLLGDYEIYLIQNQG
jgi:hypothetical protein